MGPSKNKSVGVCAHVCVAHAADPTTFFLLTDAGPSGESWQRQGGRLGCCGNSSECFWEAGSMKTVSKSKFCLPV